MLSTFPIKIQTLAQSAGYHLTSLLEQIPTHIPTRLSLTCKVPCSQKNLSQFHLILMPLILYTLISYSIRKWSPLCSHLHSHSFLALRSTQSKGFFTPSMQTLFGHHLHCLSSIPFSLFFRHSFTRRIRIISLTDQLALLFFS